MSFELHRKRSVSDCQNEDLDNTRDSLLSDQSQFSTETSNEEPELMIIDFEYCAYNYRGFDLANHFIEWMIDYTNKEYPFFFYKSEQYPNIEQQVGKFMEILFLHICMFANFYMYVFHSNRSDSSSLT